ncbi:MAG TPA: hypothetical protein EYP60_00425, partial [bacterium (Candidatus Stahlbacteria)]|nr:hypothetical protein [Candidatus Stahlbacteria bacterium]
MKLKMTVFDVETTPNKCMVGFKDLESGKITQFDSSEGSGIAKYLKGRICIGFNNLNYDNI